jgi:hypothetical protein
VVQHAQTIRRYVEFNVIALRLLHVLCRPATAVDHVSVGIEASTTKCLLANSDVTAIILEDVVNAGWIPTHFERERRDCRLWDLGQRPSLYQPALMLMHWRRPMDMMVQGWSTSLFQAVQQ